MKIFHWIGGSEDGLPVAICLEHDIVWQADTKDQLPGECALALRSTYAADREEGNDPTTRPAPPPNAVAEFRAMPDAWEFSVTLDEEA